MKIRLHPWRDLCGALAAGTLVLLFCGVLLWHDPRLFWKDDYEISILPVFADMARSWSQGELPLLSPYSWVCGNLAGEFQYGLFSIFVNAAVVLIWKFPLGFAQQAAALSMTHLFVLGAGAFLLGRGRKLAPPLAIMVALAAALNGWIMCWGASDWFGSLGAFAWVPWTWWAMERALNPTRSKWRFLWPAPFVYLVVTGGFPYTVGMLLLVAAWLAVKSLGQTGHISLILPLSLGVVLGFGLSAPAWLALLDYAHDSARATNLDPGSHWQWIVPPAALPGFVFPGWTVPWADFSTQMVPHAAIELACGTVPPLALCAGLCFRFREFVRQMKWELGLLGLVLILCMVPSAGLFRWSFRWLPLLHLVLALVAATALTQFHLGSRWNWLLVACVFASLLATYLVLPTSNGVPQYHFAPSLTNPEPLDPNRLYLSIYPPPETADRIENHPAPVGRVTRPGSTSMWAGIRLVNGYSPIRPAGVARDFAFYTHGEIDHGMADYLLGWEAGPDGSLAALGVDGILIGRESASSPPPASEWQLVHASADGRVYHRRGNPIPILHGLKSRKDRPNEKLGDAAIRLEEVSRQKISAEISVPLSAPALVAISRPYFRGYHARLNGEKLVVESYRGFMPIIKLHPGTHGRLTIVYRPWWFVLGGSIALLSLAVCLFCAWRAFAAAYQEARLAM